ncbi:MAG: saccharopine dehydrogenase family protein [Phycisphaerales bacterium]
MKQVLVVGAGRIGRMAGHFLSTCGDYRVRVIDPSAEALAWFASNRPEIDRVQGDVSDVKALDAALAGCWAVLSCAPFHCNPGIASRAKAAGVHYLDLTEDVAVTKQVMQLAEGASTAFIPQCGLAPGFIAIAGRHLARGMARIRELRMRVGALPRHPANMLGYNLTWSTAGLINEYLHPCEAIDGGECTTVAALEGHERLVIDGVEFEAFNTSGGLGTLAESLKGRADRVNYKTIRFPGHRDLVWFLLHEMGFAKDPEGLGKLWEREVPATEDDQVVVFVSASGLVEGRLVERTYARCILHQDFDGLPWTAIQITTAAGICAVVDLLASGKLPTKGFVRMEDVEYADFIGNRFGKHYA